MGEPQSSLTVIASPGKQFLNILRIIRSKEGFISTQLNILRGYETATRFIGCQADAPRRLCPAFNIHFALFADIMFPISHL